MASFVLAFITSFISLQVLMRTSWRKQIVAYENERSMHKGIIPRFGGIGIILGITAGWLFLGVDSWWLVLFLGLSVAFVSFLDDIFQLTVWLRLATQFVMAFIFVYMEFGFTQVILGILLIFCIVWMLNLYNFMDGLDGLAGGMAVFGFSTFAIAAYFVASDLVMLKAAFVVVAATLAFLRWNLHPARLFLGDVGSTSIGFIAAAFSFYGWREGMWPFWFPIIVFMPFIADASVTLAKRFFNGENIWEAHNKHYYQRLARMGWSHPTVGISYYSAMGISAATALLLLSAPPLIQVLGLCCLVIILASVFLTIDLKWQRFITRQPSAVTHTEPVIFDSEEGFSKPNERSKILPL